MKHKLTNNLSLKFLSLLVALLIWFFVVNIDNPIKSRLYSDVKIQVINEDSVTEIDKVFDIVSDETVVVKVTERRSVLSALSRDDFIVTADMENLTDLGTVPLTVACTNPAVTWDELEIMPSHMKVKLEQIKQNEFPVNISIIGETDSGFEVGSTELVQGKTVQIAGAESMLNRIGQVVAQVNVSHFNTDRRVSAQIKIYDKNGDELTAAQMSRLQIKNSNGVLLADNSVIIDVNIWDVMLDVPVQISEEGTPADGYMVTGVSCMPVTVNLVGTAEALAALNGVITLKDSISVEGKNESFTTDVDISETLASIGNLRLIADADPIISVTVQMEKTGDYEMTLPLSNLEIKNRPEKMNLTYSPADEIVLVVRSDFGKLRLKNSDVKASIDLSSCDTPGTYTIPVEIELPDGYALVSDVNLVVTADKQEKDKE